MSAVVLLIVGTAFAARLTAPVVNHDRGFFIPAPVPVAPKPVQNLLPVSSIKSPGLSPMPVSNTPKPAYNIPVISPPPAINMAAPQNNSDNSDNTIPTHMDPVQNPGGCSSCHSSGGGQKSCFNCHGTIKTSVREEARTDLESLRMKPSVHPFWTTGGLYARYQQKPQANPLAPRYVSCLDCHNPHEDTPSNPTRGAMGYSAVGVLDRAQAEYEICFRCHADSANKPAGAENLRLLFNPMNPSYHPVELPGRNMQVPSLTKGYTTASTIKCTDCHGNSDPSGPIGPHGSDYAPILVRQYNTLDGPESPEAYALCYGCHDRNSILGDQSFQAHKFHIVYEQASCHDCHTAHGSTTNSFLIQFDTSVVTNGSAGGPLMISYQAGKPYCYLSCHGADHGMTQITGPMGSMKWPW